MITIGIIILCISLFMTVLCIVLFICAAIWSLETTEEEIVTFFTYLIIDAALIISLFPEKIVELYYKLL